MRLVLRVVLGVLCVLAAAPAHAQVQTGSITGTITDISGGVMFLASAESDYVNGAILNIDGGWLAR